MIGISWLTCILSWIRNAKYPNSQIRVLQTPYSKGCIDMSSNQSWALNALPLSWWIRLTSNGTRTAFRNNRDTSLADLVSKGCIKVKFVKAHFVIIKWENPFTLFKHSTKSTATSSIPLLGIGYTPNFERLLDLWLRKHA